MLVEKHATETYRLAAAIVGVADAADVTQETFVSAWQQLPKLRDAGAFDAMAAADLRQSIAELAAESRPASSRGAGSRR